MHTESVEQSSFVKTMATGEVVATAATSSDCQRDRRVTSVQDSEEVLRAEVGADGPGPVGPEPESLGEAPLVDACKFSVRVPGVIPLPTSLRLREALRNRGVQVMTAFPRARRGKAERTVAVVRPAGSDGQFLVECATDLNGIVWSRELHEESPRKNAPRALDNNTNIFRDKRMYSQSEELFVEQLAHLQTVVRRSSGTLISAFEQKGLSPPALLSLFIRQIELAWHLIVSQATAGAELALIMKRGASLYGSSVYIGSENHKVAVKGVRFKPINELVLAVYLKEPDLIRLEVRWQDDYFKKYRERHRSQLDDARYLSDLILDLRRQGWSYVKPLIEVDTSSITLLSETDALAELSRVVGKYTAVFLIRLREGDGRLTVSSGDPLYRKVKSLLDEGILTAGAERGESFLASPYRSLLKDDTATRRVLTAFGGIDVPS